MLYDGFNNDINDASYKLSKIALKNTPSKNPKEFKTTADREAEINEGKVASIINLVDEIDTTIFVINDKLDDIDNNYGDLSGGTKLGKRGNSRLPVAQLRPINNKDLLKEIKNRGLSGLLPKKHKKDDYLRILEPYAQEIIREYNESLPPLEIPSKNKEAEFEPEMKSPENQQQTQIPLTPLSPLFETPRAEEPEGRLAIYDYTSSEDEEDEEEYTNFLNRIGREEEELPNTSTYQEMDGEEELPNISTYQEMDGEEELPNTSTYQEMNGEDGGDGGDDKGRYDFYNELIQSNLNSNIMKLEEQANRLSKLTKGLNTFVNYSSSTEAEKLFQSNEKLIVSYEELNKNINDIPNILKKFSSKMNSILTKISVQFNLIKSALGGYSGVYITGGSIFLPIAAQLMKGAGREENLAYMNSSKKRFY